MDVRFAVMPGQTSRVQTAKAFEPLLACEVTVIFDRKRDNNVCLCLLCCDRKLECITRSVFVCVYAQSFGS